MRQIGDARTIVVKKVDLLAKIEENKQKHIKEYEEAVLAYKEEAALQLKEQKKALSEGSLEIALDLVTPINKREEYDKIKTMFNWEVKDEVELSQAEFNQYVFDELPFSTSANFANTFYTRGGGKVKALKKRK